MKKRSYATLLCIVAAFLFVGADCGDLNQNATQNNPPPVEDVQAQDLKHSFGIGTDAFAAITNPDVRPFYDQLKAQWKIGDWSLRTARRNIDLTPGASYLKDAEALKQWLFAVVSDGLQPVVGVSVKGTTDPATMKPVHPTIFGVQFRSLLSDFPGVKYWGIVNEPDREVLPTKEYFGTEKKSVPTLEGATWAVDYFAAATKELESCKAQGKCQDVVLIAGEFSYQEDLPGYKEYAKRFHEFWIHYGKKMAQAARDNGFPFPRIWGFHPYIDTMRGNTAGTVSFINKLIEIEEYAIERDPTLKKGALRVWLTETGTLLRLTECAIPNLNGSALEQYAGAGAVYQLIDAQGVDGQKRVDRLYWWQFVQHHINQFGQWDSALIDRGTTPPENPHHKPRPAFCALTQPPPTVGDLSSCNGDLWADNCQNSDPPNPCVACETEHCSEATVAYASPAAAPTVQCTKKASCLANWNKCYQQHPGGASAVQALSACINMNCFYECKDPNYACHAKDVACHDNAECQAIAACVETNCPPSSSLQCWVDCANAYPNGAALWNAFWTCDNDQCKAPLAADAEPLWQYWNETATDHFYTLDRDDANLAAAGWAFVGSNGRMFRYTEPGTIPVFRYWNSTIGDHYYTTVKNDAGLAGFGYVPEGVTGYILTTQQSGTVPLHQYWSEWSPPAGIGDHYYTEQHFPDGFCFGACYVHEGALGYVYFP